MGFSYTDTERCFCAIDLLAPLRTKMKVLKKFKRRIGLSSGNSSSSDGTNNLPPLAFHQVHGDNIHLSRGGTVARRAESFCKGVTFTNRPVKILEKVYVKFLDVSDNWSGVIRFGFTCNDPINLRQALPKYACPDLTNKTGYWAKALAERFCEQDTVLFYYVTHAGDVHFGINGEEKGIFFSGVETRGQLWAMIDVYGNSTSIELLDARHQLNNNSHRRDLSPDVNRLIIPSMASLSILPASNGEQPLDETPVLPPFQHSEDQFNPLPFHRTRGRNIKLSNDRCIASRTDTEFCQGYVFTARPINLGETIVIQVMETEPMYLGALALGLTSCDPGTLQSSDLPDDSDLLLDRLEYWVVSKDVANSPQRGDKLTFCITQDGELQISKNGSAPSVLMHVDQSLTLWAFLDVYGSTQKIKILGSSVIESTSSACSSPVSVVPSSSRALRVSLPEPTRDSDILQLASGAGSVGTLLVVNLPPTPAPAPLTHPTSSATLLSTYSHTYVEPINQTYSTLYSPEIRQWAETTVSQPSGSECSICYERTIDSVLYMCGHMCMCYDCAVQQWRGKGGGHCPMCRAIIRDVIRTYKS